MAVTLALGAACGEVPPPGDSPTAGVLDEATEAERRLRIGKGDHLGTCQGACGAKATHGSCWCDELCDKYGDCCDDKAAVCDADAPCFVGGCSSQVCSSDPDVITICDMLAEYACYPLHGACGRQADGMCGWAPTAALEACVDEARSVCAQVSCFAPCEHGYAQDEYGCDTCACNPPPPSADSCAGSCGGKAPSGACWCDAQCATYGDCCADKAAACDAPPTCPSIVPPSPEFCPDGEVVPNVGAGGCIFGFSCVASEPCYVGGCSAQLCGAEEGMISTCEWKQEYACYQKDFATCERQGDGSCGWTPNDELLSCVEDAANACHPYMCAMYCEHGFVKDDNGCDVCECAPSPSACAGHCGGKSPAGCWCDAHCAGFGDCCPGKAAVCD